MIWYDMVLCTIISWETSPPLAFGPWQERSFQLRVGGLKETFCLLVEAATNDVLTSYHIFLTSYHIFLFFLWNFFNFFLDFFKKKSTFFTFFDFFDFFRKEKKPKNGKKMAKWRRKHEKMAKWKLPLKIYSYGTFTV